MMRRPRPEPTRPGQESVWSYPRPPALDPSTEHVVVEFAGRTVADTRRAIRVLETSHPPTYYIPFEDVDRQLLVDDPRRTFCEFKGAAAYADIVVGEQRARLAAWWYPEPTAGFGALRDHVTFYPSRVDPRRRRGGPPQRGRLLRRLDHLPGERSVQGRTRNAVVVTQLLTCPPLSAKPGPVSPLRPGVAAPAHG